jgi:hypothetical protein
LVRVLEKPIEYFSAKRQVSVRYRFDAVLVKRRPNRLAMRSPSRTSVQRLRAG